MSTPGWLLYNTQAIGICIFSTILLGVQIKVDASNRHRIIRIFLGTNMYIPLKRHRREILEL